MPRDSQAAFPRRHWLALFASLLLLYLVAAYMLIPLGWITFARLRPSFDDNPRITSTGDDHPGDPLNVALIGDEDDLKRSLEAAGWAPANSLSLKSDLRIAADTVLKRPDDVAPVSNLYLFGRKEDLAFERPVGHNPRQRHHVRFWKSPQVDSNGRHVWIGSASYDERIGLSKTTGQVTHHIAPNIDQERDRLIQDLQTAGELADFDTVKDFHTTRTGSNGGGDKWQTDGALAVGVLRSPSATPKRAGP